MSPRRALAALALVVLALFGPLVASGEVVFPHDNALQVGLAGAAAGDGERSNLRFSDESSYYVPELRAHLVSPRSGWIATWTDAVELGRPLTHLSGLSPAYPPTWLLMRCSSDAFTLYTWLVALTVAATALFAFLFFRALALDPWICAAGAAAAALGVPVLYWLTFLMNVSGFCWTFCLLWLVTRQVERATLGRGIAIAAASAALVLSGYPQQVLWHVAFVGLWAIVRLRRGAVGARPRRASFASLGGIALAGLVGVLAASPALLDVALAVQRSARGDVDPEFFLSALPRIATWRDAALQAALLVDPRFLGNPIEPAYPLLYGGVAIGPLLALALALSWRKGAWREHVAAYALLAVALAMTFSPALYELGVEHLGLHLSRTVPSWGAIVPAIVCGTMTLDALVRDPPRGAPVVCALVLACVALLRWAVAPLVPAGAAHAWLHVLAFAALGLAAVFFVRRTLAFALVAFALPLVDGRELILARPRSAIRTDSPLVAGLRERVAAGGRYAIVGEQPKFALPANQELLLDLASVHSYDSLSPSSYQQWVLRVSRAGTRTYGRRFNRIQDESLLAAGELEKAGVTHVLSARELSAPNLVPDVALGPLLVYRTRAEANRALVLAAERVTRDAQGVSTRGPWTEGGTPVRWIEDQGDRALLAFEPDRLERWLVLRRQFHPQWRASSGGRELECALVDGFYQGVQLPAGTSEVELEFRPWARFAWVPWPLFALGALGAAFAGWRTRRRRT